MLRGMWFYQCEDGEVCIFNASVGGLMWALCLLASFWQKVSSVCPWCLLSTLRGESYMFMIPLLRLKDVRPAV